MHDDDLTPLHELASSHLDADTSPEERAQVAASSVLQSVHVALHRPPPNHGGHDDIDDQADYEADGWCDPRLGHAFPPVGVAIRCHPRRSVRTSAIVHG